jgi:Ca-activated chloride channel homolog
MRLAEPWWLVLLVLAVVPRLLAQGRPRVAWPTLQGLGMVQSMSVRFKSGLPFLLKGLALACVAVALARPQTIAGRTRIAGQGVAIVVALDQSSSMTQDDGDAGVSRLEAARRALAGFVAGRGDDPIGLVVFANYPDLACPPTLDHAFLLDAVNAVRPARAGDDGTNLGDAIIASVEALKRGDTPKKILILLTDGRNSPAVPHPADPLQAATIARQLGVTVHTIAVGRPATTTHVVDPVSKLEVTTTVEGPDLALLERIARAGGGRAFAADDPGALINVFQAIDILEKSPVRGEVRTRYREQYAGWAFAALALLVVDRVLSVGPLRRLP